MRDRELIELLRRDPERGFRQLTDQYTGLVWSVVRARLGEAGTREDVEECVSDAFAAFYLSLDRMDPDSGTVKAYLCAIARHKAIDRCEALVRSGGVLSLEAESERAALADEFSVEEAFISAQRRRAVIEAVAALGYPDREIIVRKFLLGESSRSVAEDLGMTVSAVDTRTHRALKRLRSEWEETEA
ncbi:MAG: sigma-70 family RNA polymerase sigma factor [Oscillospiraceae bacterium]|nr:sigma-70 family RNA polymerase sigma factor [Oscillospiraceae bacterium]